MGGGGEGRRREEREREGGGGERKIECKEKGRNGERLEVGMVVKEMQRVRWEDERDG